MKAPHLNRSLTLEAAMQTADGAGGLTTNWAPVGILWAELKAASAREAAGYGLPIARVMYRITVRAAPMGSPRRPVAGQRFRAGTRRFAIEAVFERDPDARFLTCIAKEERAS